MKDADVETAEDADVQTIVDAVDSADLAEETVAAYGLYLS